MAGECPVCCEAFNRTTRAPISCPVCEYPACATCVKRYMLSTTDDMHCMIPTCKRAWTLEFQDTVLPKSFRKGEWKEHREAVLYERERAMLPATQIVVERMQHEKAVKMEITELTAERTAIDRRIYAKLNGLRVLEAEARNGTPDVRREFIKPCVANGCRGFLNAAYRCGICRVRVCPKCHEVMTPTPGGGDDDGAIDDDDGDGDEAGEAGGPSEPRRPRDGHTCNPDTVQSLALIARDSRPCPTCKSMIYRIDGCSQMFCTAPGCNTAFDWRTGRLVTGALHNPHYYEFLRQQQLGEGGNRLPLAREPGDIPCGGLPATRSFLAMLQASHGREAVLESELLCTVLAAHRVAVHVLQMELGYTFREPPPVTLQTNMDVRIRFLMNEIDTDQMKRTLQMREKARNKQTAIFHVLSMFAHVAADNFRGIVTLDGRLPACREAMANMDALRAYSNESLRAVSRRFDCVVPLFKHDWSGMVYATAASSKNPVVDGPPPTSSLARPIAAS